MTDDGLKKRLWEAQREIDRLTGANQALQDVNGKLQIERALHDVRRLENEVALLRRQMRDMETRHEKAVTAFREELKRLSGRVDAGAVWVKEQLENREAS